MRRIFGERAGLYSASPAHSDAAVLGNVVALSAPRSEWLALDIGAGTGHTALALAPFVARVVATDLTFEMLVEAERSRALRAIANVEPCLADVHRLPFADRSIDLIVCRRAAHHFSNISQALTEISRVLRPRGRFVIDDRSVPGDDFVDDCMNNIDRLHDESHVRQYRLTEWQAMLADAGFAVERSEQYVKHRPLSAFTDNVPPQNAAKIHAIVRSLDPTQREALNCVDIDGTTYLNHWYVMIAAVPAGTAGTAVAST